MHGMTRTLLSGLAGLLLSAAHARADDLGGILPMPESSGYVKECGSCHTAYAPAYLPARSWRKLMAALDRHFGDDASLGADERDALLAQLVALAGDSRRGAAAIDRHNARIPPSWTPSRVTETPFYSHMHDEVPASIWARPKIGGKANCGACHPRADEGRYSEREVRIPQ